MRIIILMLSFSLLTFTLIAQGLTVLDSSKEAELHSAYLKTNQKIKIWIPKNYSQTTIKYPVIIFFDAHDNTLSNVITSNVDRLIFTGDMPPAITIGIVQPNRFNQLNPQRQGKAFELFLRQELFKYLDSSYRTLNYHVIIGHSLGGLLATDFLTTSPRDVNAVIAISPALSRHDGNNKDTFLVSFNKFLLSSESLNNMYFISTGNEGFNDKEYIKDAAFKALNILVNQHSGLKWKFEELKGQNHATTPLISVPLGLTYIFHSWRFPDELAVQIQEKKTDPLTAIKSREDTIRKAYGTNIPVNMNAYYAAIDIYKETKDTEKLLSVFRHLIDLNPGEAENYIGVAELLEINNPAQALKFYKTALIHINPSNKEGLAKTQTKINQLSVDTR